jgi:EAL domain-containing protein (putative c-di-GMP-specific phosphodiesterase class I)
VFVSASIGVALSSTGYDRAEDHLRDADTAMYRAKAQGAGRHEIFDASMHEHAVRVLQLETDLRRAIERQEFRLHYQPIVSLPTGQIAGFEAMVRWLHPERGLLPPAEFIAFAEHTQLIIPITRWVLQEACSQVRIWQTQFPANFPFSVSVNLTAKYLAKRDLLEEITALISANGMAPENLVLEITESQIMEDPESVSSSLLHLSDSGVKVHIDDFGTGYSSLGYLASFPVHALKIDRAFVQTLNGDNKNASIVRSVISLAHNLGLEVIAEGVETAYQLEYLRALKCQYAQGFFFSPPVDQGEVARLLSEWSGVNRGKKVV